MPGTTTQMAPAPAGDVLRPYIYSRIVNQRGTMDLESVLAIAENIAFLIRHAYSPTIAQDLERISVTHTLDRNRSEINVVVHELSRENLSVSRIIVFAGVDVRDAGHNLMDALAKKVNSAALRTLKRAVVHEF